MTTLAILILVLFVVRVVLPGRSTKQRLELRDLDWSSAHIYMNLCTEMGALALAVWVIRR
jgi:hypothetical protein